MCRRSTEYGPARHDPEVARLARRRRQVEPCARDLQHCGHRRRGITTEPAGRQVTEDEPVATEHVVPGQRCIEVDVSLVSFAAVHLRAAAETQEPDVRAADEQVAEVDLWVDQE